jgi:DNA invertase Pin-like site-specific DNA recombinase
MRAFLYARVSTADQAEGMQTAEMLESAKRREWQTEVFADPGFSGAKESRPEFDRMMALARKRKCDVIMVYRYDRFARSVRQLVNALEEFDRLGIQFVSVHENIDTTLPHGRLMFHIFASIAEFERELIRQRVRSGMQDAKEMLAKHGETRKGKTRWAGRPRVVADSERIMVLHAQRVANREIARQVGISEASVRRILKSAAKPRQKPIKKAVQK